ncbi:NADP-dependent oxidoreductase [Pedobacter miscanthi]|uniref:NADP-dependent oxidoreductase n=1 Tax=Pedobacter miscanthi TaxID=2259170 RepID=A0A366LDB0_9SPHI|nr:NADP-dependent oxidoreductase [Pedobacter miscanthi]RBQ11875.1 NADP-dependent oxidoreductase [Pedobacter miscanthi]
MKAILLHKFGRPEALQLGEIEKPVINDDQVLIKVIAAGINPVDAKIRSGLHRSSKNLQLPAILGKDVSGIIEQVGRNIQDFKTGDEIFGSVNGSYAEYVSAGAEAIVKKPANISFYEAAAIPVAGLTAYQAIHDHLQIKEGQKILIQSAAGGVGHLAVQFAKLAGAFVYGTASAKNAAFLAELGVDEVINYKEQKFEEIATGLDAVLDTMGGEILYRAINIVKPGGKIVCLPSSTKDDPIALKLAEERNIELIWPMMQPNKAQLQLFATLLGEENLKVKVEKVFSLNDIVSAHETIESGSVSGKIVVEIS